MPAIKKSKRRDGQSNSFASARASNSLASLPIEILAEILLYTCSPPTVLAVARSCSFLYHSLARNPAASFIWRGVRETFHPLPLPEPGHCWEGSEADYAAFVFGGGVCEVCQKYTRAIYVSFAVQIRLCSSWYCRRKFLDESLIDVTTSFQGQDRQSLWAPYVESNLCFYPSTFPGSTWPRNDTLLFRKADWEKFQLDLATYRSAEQFKAKRNRAMAPDSLSVAGWQEDDQRERLMERCHVAIQRFPAIMEVCRPRIYPRIGHDVYTPFAAPWTSWNVSASLLNLAYLLHHDVYRQLSANLIHWKYDYDRESKVIKKRNQIWTKNLAEREGWDLSDLGVSETYGSLQRRKNFLLEEIGLKDVSPIRSTIEFELLALQTRHKRQKAEETYKQKLTEIKKTYERMRCGTLGGAHADAASPSDPADTLFLPTLSVFCTLPSVRALKGSPDAGAVPSSSTSTKIDIKSSPLATSLIISDLHTWLIPIQKRLLSLLGYPNGWQSASTRILPPLRRVTARFFCRRCGEGVVGRGYQRERCLDLKGVCSHVCVAGRGKSTKGGRLEAPQGDETKATDNRDGSRGKKKNSVKTLDWNVDVFEKDDKAIRLIKTILELTGLSEEDSSTTSSLSAEGGIIRCMTCEGWIVMDFDTAIGHAHRHESMQIELLSTPTPTLVMLVEKSAQSPSVDECRAKLNLAFERGTSGLLLQPSYHARTLCKKANYGCRHCFPDPKRNIVVGGVGIVFGDVGKGARAMDFNGLRSHVKEKHGIQDIGDEDFFCYVSPENNGGNGWDAQACTAALSRLMQRKYANVHITPGEAT